MIKEKENKSKALSFVEKLSKTLIVISISQNINIDKV
jgi:hypothetical protein